jgi:hypothetical protein
MRVVHVQDSFLAVGDSGTILRSTDGKQWQVLVSSYIYGGFGAIAYGNNRFVASLYSQMLYSNDGVSWTGNQVASNGVNLARVAYGAGKFVVNGNNTSNAVLFTSSDGLVWHNPALPTTNPLSTVAFANNLFLAGGTGVILTSPDGEAWTIRDQTHNNWMGLTYGNGVFLALSDSGVAATSPDGIVWKTQPTVMKIDEGALTFGKGVFVTLASGLVYTSTNGVDWQLSYSRQYYTGYTALLYANDVFVISGIADIVTSLDAVHWTQRPADFKFFDWWFGPVSLGFGKDRFVRLCGGFYGRAGAELQISAAVAFLEPVQPQTAGAFQFNATAGPLDVFDVKASQDLLNWTTIMTLPKAAASSPITDAQAINIPHRFYQIASPKP